ncbi:hypothetical protein ACLB2K_061263 [Fragaria x ananassa]
MAGVAGWVVSCRDGPRARRFGLNGNLSLLKDMAVPWRWAEIGEGRGSCSISAVQRSDDRIRWPTADDGLVRLTVLRGLIQVQVQICIMVGGGGTNMTGVSRRWSVGDEGVLVGFLRWWGDGVKQLHVWAGRFGCHLAVVDTGGLCPGKRAQRTMFVLIRRRVSCFVKWSQPPSGKMKLGVTGYSRWHHSRKADRYCNLWLYMSGIFPKGVLKRAEPTSPPPLSDPSSSWFMSSKERPTLGGTRIKTRKRNIAAPLDPAAFADAVVQIYLDNAGDLELIAKSIESSDLNFSRYGDTFFEVVFTGGRTQPGTTKPDEGERHPYSILESEPRREVIIPSVIYIQKILRRRPFLIKNLENVMRRFLQSLELFEENERKKLAIFTALAFSQKLSGLPPETVFQPMLKDNLVGKGLVLSFITEFFKEYLIDNSLDDLISILKRGKVEDNLLDFFPATKRTEECFSEHFTKEGLVALVEYNEKKIFEVKLKDMKSALTTQITEETDISEVIETVKQRVKDAKLPDVEVVRILWDVIMDAVQWSGKNQQQNANAALRQVKTWAELLNAFCNNGKLELELIYKVQMQCYEDAKLMKLFTEIVRSLYDQDVLAEDTILHWFRKGTNPKGRQTFVKALEPFVKWLEEAEEEE